MRCPGQDSMFWKTDDVFEIPCPKCSYGVEFLKYDVKRRCRCGHEIVNPKINFGCAEWCPYGESCIEGLPEEVKAQQKEEKGKRLKERISQEMKRYFGGDSKRINHALKVARYAEEILKIEGGNPIVVLGAAYLHEIGIKKAEEKYGNGSAKHQETECPDIAREILYRLNVQKKIVDEICDIVRDHHHPREKETLHSRILDEANWLVKIEEDRLDQRPEELEEIFAKIFKTATGKRLAKELYFSN